MENYAEIMHFTINTRPDTGYYQSISETFRVWESPEEVDYEESSFDSSRACDAQYANSLAPTVDIDGTTYNVELVIVDNESSNDRAATAASMLVNEDVSVVLGSYGSGVSIAGSDTFRAAGVPAIGITCTNPQVTEGNTHYFRICYLDPFQGTVLANYAYNELGARTAYCLAKLGDDYSGGLVNYFIQQFKALGGTCISETFPDGNSDFTSYVNNAKNSGAEVFFSPVSTEAAQLIIDQSSSQGHSIRKAQILSSTPASRNG